MVSLSFTNNLAMVAAMEKFLAPYLGGRQQEDVLADVAAKLKEIIVDPKTVEWHGYFEMCFRVCVSLIGGVRMS